MIGKLPLRLFKQAQRASVIECAHKSLKNQFFTCTLREILKNQHFMPVFEQLSRREREVMELIFALGQATLGELAERMDSPPTRPAMRSIIKGLENKGLLKQAGKRGREFVFEPVPKAQHEGQSALAKLLSTFFGGSMKEGIAAYLSDPSLELNAEELETIEELVREAKRRANTSQKEKNHD